MCDFVYVEGEHKINVNEAVKVKEREKEKRMKKMLKDTLLVLEDAGRMLTRY